ALPILISIPNTRYAFTTIIVYHRYPLVQQCYCRYNNQCLFNALIQNFYSYVCFSTTSYCFDCAMIIISIPLFQCLYMPLSRMLDTSSATFTIAQYLSKLLILIFSLAFSDIFSASFIFASLK